MHTNAHESDENPLSGTHQNIIFGAPEGHDARILADKAREIMRDDGVLMHIALDDTRVQILGECLKFFAPDVQVLTFPAWDCLPYDRVSPHGDIVAHRVSTLCDLIRWENEKERYPRILITTVNAALQRVMPKTILRESSFYIKAGETLDIDNLTLYLTQNGYIRSETVREPGDFAIRGGLIDLYPAGNEKPIRIDLFDDEVETLKIFDPLSQRAEGKAEELILRPVSEFFLDDVSISRFRAAYREAFGVVQNNDPLYEAVSEGRKYNGMEHWLPLFYEQMEAVTEYISNVSVTMDHHSIESAMARLDHIQDFYETRQTLKNAAQKNAKKGKISGTIYNPVNPAKLYLSNNEWSDLCEQGKSLYPFMPHDNAPTTQNENTAKKGRDFADIRALPDGDVIKELKLHISALKGQNKKTLICAYSDGAKSRLLTMMENATIKEVVEINDANDLKKMKPHQTGVTILSLGHGFVAQDIAVITEQDILGDRVTRKKRKSKKADNFLTEVSSLDENDLVVHIDHGIGRFLNLETINAAGTSYDCLKLEYSDGDKLYIPVINLDVLSRFGPENDNAQLDKLGGAGWQARKAKAKKNLMEIADKLLGIAAARQLRKAQHLEIDSALYEEFVARFPYDETEDQDRSIKSVLEGMEGNYPMDHLVCGDVGFGKTEVALRAAYVAAMSGAQVAIAVPTTLLARQHYNNFQKRFAGTGIQIEQLSRMVTAKDKQRAKDGIADGTTQIVIGTHALFAKNIKFKNLGLLIIDEEQKFGVKQKERLKELKNNVHVLTLTATPIPRTLQMALTGVKEMSLITTPPVDRLAIRTFVMPFDSMVIRDALLREHYRGGQSFYVVPRIKDLADVSETLKELVPELKIVEAHGQLSPTELEDRMTAFYDGQYDVLLATNIIESGIDIPTANTMVVHRSDMFGLAQLYQIRGRIGRSKQRAYAYLTYEPQTLLNPNAQKRLEVMETLDTLGSGFQLASHDMDIRGAGNLLGDAQSGHIKEVGVELYQQMLEEAVAAAKAGITDIDDIVDEDWSPQINIGASVLIPETYVEDLSVRMSLYRRLNDLDEREEIDDFAEEIIDRFGKLPSEVNNLLDILEIKLLCKKAGISHVDAGPKGAVLTFRDNVPPNVEGLMQWITKKAGTVKIKPDQKLSIIRSWHGAPERIKGVRTLMKELSELNT